MNLHAIVYVSTAVGLPDTAAIQRLLTSARRRNAERGVSGLLLYSDGSFMQYIEGPRDGLQVVYDVIRADPQHHNLIELLNEPVAEREFAGWDMAYRTQMLPDFLRPPRRGQGQAGAPLGPGRQLLQTVWRDARQRLL